MTRKRIRGSKVFIGWDTETVKNGQIVIITNSKKEYLVLPKIDDILEFMLKYQNDRFYNYFYNMNYDIKSLIMTLSNQHNKIKDIKLYLSCKHLAYKDYTLHFIEGKCLTIWKNYRKKLVKFFDKNKNKWVEYEKEAYDKKAVFYDISQFYLNKYGKIMKLQVASETYLGHGKLEVDDIGNVSVYDLINNERYRKKLVEYCIRDSQLVRRLTYLFYNNIKSIVDTHKLLSPAYLAQLFIKKHLKRHNLEEQYTNKWITKYEKEILYTYYGGRFETIKKGTPEQDLFLYDINSAYPFIMSQLKGLTGQATIVKEDDLETEKCYPICNITIGRNIGYLNPLAYKTNDGIVYFPSNRREVTKWVTQWDIENLKMCNVDFTINKIIKFWTTDNLLFDFIHELYKMKKEGDYQKVAKIILNSSYGKTIEKTTRHKLVNDWIHGGKRICIDDKIMYVLKNTKVKGQIYNPLWGTLITAFTRHYIIKPIIQNHLENNLYQIATDSILLDKKIELPMDKELGNWGLDIIPNPTIYGNGILSYGDEFKSRGFMCFDIDEFNSIIDNEKYTKEMIIPLNHYKKWGFNRLHSFQEIEKNFTILDRKRKFQELKPKQLKNNLIDSKPLFWN